MTSLLYDVEKYLRLYKEKPATFGRRVMGDPSLVFDLRKGRSPSERTAAKVRKAMMYPPSGPPVSIPSPGEQAKPGDIWETVEDHPRLIQIKGTSVIDPDVLVAEVANLDSPTWIVKATGKLIDPALGLIQARPVSERKPE